MNFRFKILDFRFLIVALIGIAFSSCGRQEPIEYSLSDMQGLWKEDGTEHFMRFTTDAADSLKTGYLWGYEWDEGDGTQESDLFEPDMKYGNSWFIYSLEGQKWYQTNTMSIGSGLIPETYVITILNSSTFEYYKEGYKNEKQTYTKQ